MSCAHKTLLGLTVVFAVTLVAATAVGQEDPPVIDLNKGTLEELDTLPGIGPAKAEAIIAFRKKKKFGHPLDLRQVSGIGPSTYKNLCRRIAVGPLRGCDAEGVPPPLPAEEIDATSDVRVNLNTANPKELGALPGIGPAKALLIIERRKTEGPYTDPKQLLEVKGIGPKTLEKLQPFVRTTVDPNQASAAELVATGAVPRQVARSIVRRAKKKPFTKPEEVKSVKGVDDAVWAKLQPFLAIN